MLLSQGPIVLRWKLLLLAKIIEEANLSHRLYYPSCRVDGCERVVMALGYCNLHYQRLKRNGTTDDLALQKRGGKDSPTWKGGKPVRTANGYYRVWISRNDPLVSMATKGSKGQLTVLQHRLAMARHLGRPLLKSETVHHINGDRLDNRIENLQLRNNNHGKGQQFKCLDCGSHNVEAIGL